ncbi:MAG TPA: flavin reductase family protein [Bacilli bacterium]|nr:flavin reductase family protein [Bacilli bacterium]
MIFNMDDLNQREKYRLLTSCIVPRPIAWVTTISEDGIYNAAPFSFFTGVSIEPPLVIFAVERRDGMKKDTVVNIEQTKQFVINIVTESNANQMNETSKDYQPFEDELVEARLTPIPSSIVMPPSIKESPIHMECQLEQIIEIGSSPHSLVIGEVKAIHVDDEFMNEGRIDMSRLAAVGRMGGKWYIKTNDLFELDRLDWRKEEV